MFKKIQKIKQKGFTLVEVLFALLVLTVGITSVLFIMVRNIKNSIEAKDQIIAAELMQEGIELVRNLSDNLDSRIVTGASYTDTDYRVDTVANTINFTNMDTNRQLFTDSQGVYSHTATGTATKFTRSIDVADDAGSGQRTITSTVSWNGLDTIPTPCNIATHCASADSVISY